MFGPSCDRPSPGHHPATDRVKWNKEVNKVVLECFYRSKMFVEEGKHIRRFKKRMFRQWREKGLFKSSERRVCDQARTVRKNG